MDAKAKAIVAHITLIGWIVALVLNSQQKDEFTSFYIRQMLGLILFSLISFIPVIGWILWLGVAILWILSLVSAIQGEMKPVPIFGEMFQKWFASL